MRLQFGREGIKKLVSGGDIDSCNGEFYLFKDKLDSAVASLLGSTD